MIVVQRDKKSRHPVIWALLFFWRLPQLALAAVDAARASASVPQGILVAPPAPYCSMSKNAEDHQDNMSGGFEQT